MKQLCLLILILLTAQGVQGQKIRFTDTSNVWYQSTHTWEMSQMSPTISKGDSTINGIVYQKLYTINKSSTYLHLLIREDTLANKIYYWDDTTERVLYDFSLKIGDTITYMLDSHYVTNIDSLKIDSIWYKTFDFASSSNPSGPLYTVIENIGCTRSLKYPTYTYRFLGSSRLNCFYNNGMKPALSKPIGLFDNNDSCYTYIIYVSVDDAPNSPQSTTISPHPAHSSSVITLPYNLQKGELIIYNALGQTVNQVSFNSTSKVTIGQLPGAGMYYYRVSDKAKGKVWQGKVVYE